MVTTMAYHDGNTLWPISMMAHTTCWGQMQSESIPTAWLDRQLVSSPVKNTCSQLEGVAVAGLAQWLAKWLRDIYGHLEQCVTTSVVEHSHVMTAMQPSSTSSQKS